MTQKLLFAGIDEPGLATIDGYRATGGYEIAPQALAMAQGDLVEALKASGLRGRGGAEIGRASCRERV